MDYPSRKYKRGKELPAADGDADSLGLRLAEYPAPFGEESPWRRLVGDPPEFANDAWRHWKHERGRLH
jgi:hypothetical protein